MTINTYNDLIGEIANMLASDELQEKAPLFVQMAEARFDRILNTLPQEQRATHVLAEDDNGDISPYVTVPAQFSGVKRITLIADPNTPLEYLTPTALAERFRDAVTDRPTCYTIEGVQIKLGPSPDSTYTLEIVYVEDLRPLSNEEGQDSNWLLRQAPDVYLFQSLILAEAYVVDDPRIATWKQLADEALQELRRWDRDNRIPDDVATVTDIPKPFIAQG